jgi:hypothetical protein
VRRILAAALAAAVPAVLPSASAAARLSLRFHPFATARTQAVSDGVRYLAFARRAGVVEIVDSSTGARFDVTVPEGSCWAPEAVGGGMVVTQCNAWFDPRTELVDISHRRAFVPAGLANLDAAFPSVDGFLFDRVGSSWISGLAEAYHDVNRFYLNWRTGEIRYPVGDAAVAPDLDSPQLMVPLCSPLVRARNPDYDDPYSNPNWPFDEDLQYEPPFYLQGVGERVVLRQCGCCAAKRIGRSAQSPQLGAGIVSWLHPLTRFVHGGRVGVRVNAYVAHSGRRYRRTYPRIRHDWSAVSLVHTRTRLYLNVAARRGWRTIRSAALRR